MVVATGTAILAGAGAIAAGSVGGAIAQGVTASQAASTRARGAAAGAAAIEGATFGMTNEARTQGFQELDSQAEALDAREAKLRADLAEARRGANLMGDASDFDSQLQATFDAEMASISKDRETLAARRSDFEEAANRQGAVGHLQDGFADAETELRAAADPLNQFAEQARDDLSHFTEAGQDGLTQLQQLQSELQGGLLDPQDIQNSPAYQFRLEQGMQALDRSAAARGLLGSGAAVKEASRFGQGLASTEYDNEFRRRLALAGQRAGIAGQQVGAGQFGTGSLLSAEQFRSGNLANLASAQSALAQNRGSALSNLVFNTGVSQSNAINQQASAIAQGQQAVGGAIAAGIGGLANATTNYMQNTVTAQQAGLLPTGN